MDIDITKALDVLRRAGAENEYDLIRWKTTKKDGYPKEDELTLDHSSVLCLVQFKGRSLGNTYIRCGKYVRGYNFDIGGKSPHWKLPGISYTDKEVICYFELDNIINRTNSNSQEK